MTLDKMRYRGNKPLRANLTDAGADLVTDEDFSIYPGQNMTIELGTAIDLPDGYVGLVVPRSGLGSQGLRLVNTIGVIDSSYKSNIRARIENVGFRPFTFEKGDRILQLLIVPIATPAFTKGPGAWPKELRSGFGSTGV